MFKSLEAIYALATKVAKEAASVDKKTVDGIHEAVKVVDAYQGAINTLQKELDLVAKK